jgi:hypothetical protein
MPFLVRWSQDARCALVRDSNANLSGELRSDAIKGEVPALMIAAQAILLTVSALIRCFGEGGFLDDVDQAKLVNGGGFIMRQIALAEAAVRQAEAAHESNAVLNRTYVQLLFKDRLLDTVRSKAQRDGL